MTTAQEQYSAGYHAAQALIAMLEPTMSPEAMRQLAVKNIIPIHAIKLRDDHSHGASEAWADWQSAQRLKSRKWQRR